MQIATTANTASFAGMSIIRSANEQPKLAGDLIRQTVAAMAQAQVSQPQAQPVGALQQAGSGSIIDIVA